MDGFFYDDCVMPIPTKQLNELKHLLDKLGLKYTDKDLPVIAFNIAKFVLVSEMHNLTNNVDKDN